MPLNGGLIFYLTCLVYSPYLAKREDSENHEFSLKLHISQFAMLEVKLM